MDNLESKKTIYNLSKELGLAPSTISKALNNQPGISEEKRRLVMEYAKKVKYVPTSSARMLKAKNSYSLGVIYSETLNIGLEHPFFSPVLENFKKYVEKEGYEICFISAKLGNFGTTYKEFIQNKRLSGVLIVAGNNEDVVTILSDNIDGTRQAIKSLYESGIRKIGMVLGPNNQFVFDERKKAFLEITKELNIEVKPSWLQTTKDYLYSDGYAAMKRMIEETKGDLPEAVFTVSDMYALGIIAALEDKGYHVPKDVSVVGFDDIEFAKYIKPSLSTVRQNTKEIGTIAAKTLIDMINDEYEEKYDKKIRIPATYIKRGSTI